MLCDVVMGQALVTVASHVVQLRRAARASDWSSIQHLATSPDFISAQAVLSHVTQPHTASPHAPPSSLSSSSSSSSSSATWQPFVPNPDLAAAFSAVSNALLLEAEAMSVVANKHIQLPAVTAALHEALTAVDDNALSAALERVQHAGLAPSPATTALSTASVVSSDSVVRLADTAPPLPATEPLTVPAQLYDQAEKTLQAVRVVSHGIVVALSHFDVEATREGLHSARTLGMSHAKYTVVAAASSLVHRIASVAAAVVDAEVLPPSDAQAVLEEAAAIDDAVDSLVAADTQAASKLHPALVLTRSGSSDGGVSSTGHRRRCLPPGVAAILQDTVSRHEMPPPPPVVSAAANYGDREANDHGVGVGVSAWVGGSEAVDGAVSGVVTGEGGVDSEPAYGSGGGDYSAIAGPEGVSIAPRDELELVQVICSKNQTRLERVDAMLLQLSMFPKLRHGQERLSHSSVPINASLTVLVRTHCSSGG